MRLILTIFLLVMNMNVFANSNVGDIAILLKKTPHLKVALMTLSEMKAGKRALGFNKAVVILCGKDVISAVKKGSALTSQVKALSDSIQVEVCGISLKKVGLKQEDLIKPVKVVDNGLYELIRLKNSGYFSFDL